MRAFAGASRAYLSFPSHFSFFLHALRVVDPLHMLGLGCGQF
jgi:hypothetical protein